MKRILVVEDTPEIAQTVLRNLEMDGYDTVLASKAAQALALAASEKPDLVVLDLGLPDRDGYYVLSQFRERGHLFPVMILSARNLEADKVQGFRLGADDYVTKPFGSLEMLARVAALLRRAARSAPAPAQPAPRPSLGDEELSARYGLTKRQIAVARLLARGYSNAEIAAQLSVSYFTARNHTEQVLSKLGVGARAAVGAVLFGQE